MMIYVYVHDTVAENLKGLLRVRIAGTVSENKVTILDLSGWFQETQMNNPDSKKQNNVVHESLFGAHTHRSYKYIV